MDSVTPLKAPLLNDEHQRNAGIASTVNAELAIRATKEAALAGELAAARQQLGTLASQLAQVRGPFKAATCDSDVELFLRIDDPSFMPKYRQRAPDLLHKTLEIVRQTKRETKQRAHKHTDGMPKKTAHKQAHTVLHGARFSAEIYTRGCHWIPRMFA
jgi:hypothetical protein